MLCEVLELDEDAMSAMELHERNKVLNEAKRNITQFPNLNNVERVDVNRALLKLKEDDREKDLDDEDVNPGLAAAGGRYLPVFWSPTQMVISVFIGCGTRYVLSCHLKDKASVLIKPRSTRWHVGT